MSIFLMFFSFIFPTVIFAELEGVVPAVAGDSGHGVLGGVPAVTLHGAEVILEAARAGVIDGDHHVIYRPLSTRHVCGGGK